MKYLNKYIKKFIKPFALAMACLTLEAAVDLLQPAIMSRIVDIGVKAKDMDYVLKMGGLMLFITAIGAITAIGRNIISSKVAQSFGAELRADLFRKIQGFSFENLNRFEGATLVTRLTNDINQVQNFAHRLMRIFVKAPLLCIGSLIMASLLNFKMALILAVVVPVIGLIIYFNVKLGYPYYQKVQSSLDRVNGVMREYLGGVRVVKAYNRFGYEDKRFRSANHELSMISTRTDRVMAVFSPGIIMVVNLGIVAVLWFGGYSVNIGGMETGKVIAFINYMTQILHSLIMISHVFNSFVRTKASGERIGEVFELENRMKSNSNPVKPFKEKGGIDFEGVSFSYSDGSEEHVLKDISFSVKPGERIGIIGSTGSGKSSLVNLIPRFYDTSSGIVRINGIDVKDMDLKSLRDRISIVPQRAVLFSGTILENIRWGRENATFQEVQEAAKAAEAHDFIISFPEGYDTILGQRGINLSGGQKQRISIARALVRKPEILILDDSTSAVDIGTEAKIRESLGKYYTGVTCFIIAQRITSVMETDRIIVLDNGEIVELGTHEELMKACRVYRNIFWSQIGSEVMHNGG